MSANLKLVAHVGQQQESDCLAGSIERHLRAYFAAHDDEMPAAGLYGRVLQEIERPLLAIALDECKGNQLRAAELLGLNRNTLRKKIRALGLDAGKRKDRRKPQDDDGDI